jgi:hypothetical protein
MIVAKEYHLKPSQFDNSTPEDKAWMIATWSTLKDMEAWESQQAEAEMERNRP